MFHFPYNSHITLGPPVTTTYVKTTNARAEIELKNYCVTSEDVKLLRRNLRTCLQEVTSSFPLFKLDSSGLQMIKIFFPQVQITEI